MTLKISQKAKEFAELANNSEKIAFLNAQKETFLSLNSEEKLAHFEAIKQRTEELKRRIQNPVFGINTLGLHNL